jgi:23S rRNA (cytosine1962-C5)-methyltransferase
MGAAIADALEVPAENIHLKERRTGKLDGKRYERIDHTEKKMIVSERDLRLYVNIYDYVDTGLFPDHRNTRQMVREMADGKDFLNLYCYTGSFSCYAAKGGARSTVSVDRSDTAIRWARENMELNAISGEKNTLIQSHTFDFLEKAKRKNQQFDLAVVDPPSFSTSNTKKDDFDIVYDHPVLLKAVVDLMRPGSTLFFSTNHQAFEFYADELPITDATEITSITIPEDYISKKKRIHRCWRITV